MTTQVDQHHGGSPPPADRAPDEGYQRGLSARQVQMTAIGGAIGVGLIYGSGAAIARIGPSLIACHAGAGVGGVLGVVGLGLHGGSDRRRPLHRLLVAGRTRLGRRRDSPRRPVRRRSHLRQALRRDGVLVLGHQGGRHHRDARDRRRRAHLRQCVVFACLGANSSVSPRARRRTLSRPSARRPTPCPSVSPSSTSAHSSWCCPSCPGPSTAPASAPYSGRP